MGAKVTVGIGQVCENVQELVSSYQSAREAVSCQGALWQQQGNKHDRG